MPNPDISSGVLKPSYGHMFMECLQLCAEIASSAHNYPLTPTPGSAQSRRYAPVTRLLRLELLETVSDRNGLQEKRPGTDKNWPDETRPSEH